MKTTLIIALAVCAMAFAEDELLKTEEEQKYLVLPYSMIAPYLNYGATPFTGGYRDTPIYPGYSGYSGYPSYPGYPVYPAANKYFTPSSYPSYNFYPAFDSYSYGYPSAFRSFGSPAASRPGPSVYPYIFKYTPVPTAEKKQ